MIDQRDRPRMTASDIACADCGRKFAKGYIPGPMTYGPYQGQLVCRDCRAHYIDQTPGLWPNTHQ